MKHTLIKTLALLLLLTHCGVNDGNVILQTANGTGSSGSDTDLDPSASSTFDVGEGSGTPVQEATAALTTSAQNLLEVFLPALQGGYRALYQTDANDVNTYLFYQEQACFIGGELAFSGHFINTTDTTADLDFAVRLTDCDGMNGGYTVLGGYQLIANNAQYQATINGRIGANGCLIQFDNLAIEYVQNAVLNSLTYSYTGEASGECTNGSFQCSFDQTQFQDILLDCQ